MGVLKNRIQQRVLNNGFQQNMGPTDRIVRTALGSIMLAHGLFKPNKNALGITEAVVGGAFIAYGLSGFDPLLSAFGVNTQPGDSDSLLNRIVRKQAPGQGLSPRESQQPIPKKNRRYSASATAAAQLAVR